MGTRWSARVVMPLRAPAADPVILVQEALDGVVAQMSQWEPHSDLSRFNRHPPGAWMTLPADFLHVLRAALDIASLSGGAFDPAIGRIVDGWGFGPAAPARHPAAANVHHSWRRIEMDGCRARRTADVALDFSGIAKGFGVDAAARALTAAGYRHFLVEVGGELRGSGIRPDGQPWWVDLETPPGYDLPQTRIALSGLAVATSGNYRRFFQTGGRRYSHSIDPRTAAPAEKGVLSVSVLHESAMMADAWATALTILGQREGLQLAARHGLPVLMTVAGPQRGATEYMTPALAAMFN